MFLLTPILRRLLYLAIFAGVLAVGAELVARKLVGEAVSHAVASRLGVSTKVSFGSTPLVAQIARGSLSDVSVHANGARIGGLGPLRIEGTLRDVHLRSLTGLQGAIGSLDVHAGVSPAVVLAMLSTRACAQSLPASVRAGLTTSPRVAIFPGRIDLLPPRGRAAEVQLRPQASGSDLRFEISAVDLGGSPAPAAALLAARAGSRCERTLSDLPFGVSLVSARALDGTLALSFAGRDASFSAIG